MTPILAPADANTFLSLGGYTFIRPKEWRKHLNQCLSAQDGSFEAGQAEASRNDCVLKALEQYLFIEFGLLLPEETLFPLYNPRGDGIAPQEMTEAVSAVIEPLGFEIEQIIVPDDDLREALGDSPLFVDGSHAEEFNGRPGICVVNIEAGYSHAFFWNCIKAERFHSERFRMALRIRPKDQRPHRLSTASALDEYHQAVVHWAQTSPAASQPAARVFQERVVEAVEFARSQIVWQSEAGNRAAWAQLEVELHNVVMGYLDERKQNFRMEEDDRFILDLTDAMRRVAAALSLH